MKIAILGTENSHASAFGELLKMHEKYADVELVGVYGYDQEANQRQLDAGRTSYVAEKPEDFLGKVDAIMVTARHGDLHWEYALPYVRQGIPAFIDKPFTVDVDKAKELLDAAKASGASLCGGSSLKFLDEFAPLGRFCQKHQVVGGYVAAPVDMCNEYGGFYFYAQHLTEIVISIFGEGIKAVTAQCLDEQQKRINLVLDYGDFDVVAQYTSSSQYTASVVAKEGCMAASADEVTYCYEKELDEFLEMVRTGRMPRSYEALAFPSLLLNTIEQSYRTGKRVEVQW